MTKKIYKRQPIEGSSVYGLAMDRVDRLYDLFDTICVWFSGGKDSTALLHVALEVAEARKRLPVPVIFCDEEAIDPETISYCERVAARDDVDFRWYCLSVKHRNACSRKQPWWYPWSEEDEHRWCRPMPDCALSNGDLPGFKRQPMPEINGLVFGPEFGNVASCMGIRTQESLNRYMAIANNKVGDEAFISGDSFWKHNRKCYPIYDWGWDDVWLAPHLYGWDYNTSYDTMTKAGIPPSKQRVAPPFGEQPLEGLWKFAVCWPDLWAAMTARVQGAATAGRYCNTDLYGYGSVGKPDQMSWREFCMQQLLDRLPPRERATAARVLQRAMEYHKDRSQNPLPDTEHDPDSGLSWRDLGVLASRGDLKKRRVAALIAAANQRVSSRLGILNTQLRVEKWVPEQRIARRLNKR